MKSQSQMVKCIISEIVQRKEFLKNDIVDSIYFGGGTPSLLSTNELSDILVTINDQFKVNNPEITLEANPDDLTSEALSGFKEVGINRLSIGIQTFDSERLKYLNRSHSTQQALQSLDIARKSGFNNISADLIFAIPPETDSFERFKHDLNELLKYELEHISLYNLTIEEKTAFGNWEAKGKLTSVSEESSALQYELAVEVLSKTGYDHYEVSNFARKTFYSKHNSSYWKNVPYLGVGPGAHSYNGEVRIFNISNNALYIRHIQNRSSPGQEEHLTPVQSLNEYVLTRIRTKWGLDLSYILTTWGIDLIKDQRELMNQLVIENKAELENNIFRLTSSGFSIADEVALHLFSAE